MTNAWLKSCCENTSLDLSNNSLGPVRAPTGPEGAKHLAIALQNENCKLTSLDLDCNNLGPEGAKHLAIALPNENCKLTSLNL